MKKKLLLLNTLLAGMLILGAAELYSRVAEADGRYRLLDAFAEPKQPGTYPVGQARAKVRQADYMPIVDRLLFSTDRNPVVIVEVVEEKPVERPPLPMLVGLVDFGAGPSALMTADADQAPKWIGLGDKVGDFEFRAVEGEQVTLAWQEQEFTVSKKQLNGEGLQSRKSKQARAARKPPAGGASKPAAPGTAPAPVNLASGGGQESRFGPEIAPGRLRVKPGDDSPDGTEHKGYVKRVRRTPFGSQEWWEQKQK